jgi:hypothetical protein
MHQVMVMKMLSQIYPQTEIDKRKVKAAAVVCIDCIHTTQGPEQVRLGCITPDKLNQSILHAIGQTDANNGYFVIKRAQTCGLNIKISINR